MLVLTRLDLLPAVLVIKRAITFRLGSGLFGKDLVLNLAEEIRITFGLIVLTHS